MAVLKLKSKGKDVKALQGALNKSVSAKLKEDGVFGKLTKTAVIKFQKKNSLKPDGIAGASTLAVIGLGPSLRMPKMKVKDCRNDLNYYKSKDSLQGTGGPDHIDREMIEVKIILRKLEATFAAMGVEIKKIQKDVEKQHRVILGSLDEIVKHQVEYKTYVKSNDVNGAADMASGAEALYAIFKKAEKAMTSAQKKQEKLFMGKFVKLADKTFS